MVTYAIGKSQILELEAYKRDLERQVNELKAKCEQIEKRAAEQRQVEEKKHQDEIQFLKRNNQQLKVSLIASRLLIWPKYLVACRSENVFCVEVELGANFIHSTYSLAEWFLFAFLDPTRGDNKSQKVVDIVQDLTPIWDETIINKALVDWLKSSLISNTTGCVEHTWDVGVGQTPWTICSTTHFQE